MFIGPMITWVPSGFSEYIWLDTKIVLKKYFHDLTLLRVLSHKDTSTQDRQLYMYNVKFEKMTNHQSLKF